MREGEEKLVLPESLGAVPRASKSAESLPLPLFPIPIVKNMRQLWFKIMLVAGLLTIAVSAFAQFGGSRGGGGFGNFGGGFGSRGAGGGTQRLTLDTSDIYFFFAGEPNLVFPFSDSLLESFQQYDPLRLQSQDYASLGNLGSAARPLFFQPTWHRGFDPGLHQFDIYRLSTADVRYYKITQAFTQAGYSQGSTQGDGYFNIRFSRNFADGLNLSLETHRINNIGAYDYQKAENSATAAGLWYQDKNGNYNSYFSFVSNTIEQQDNGGVAEPLLPGSLIPAYQVQMHLSNSITRHAGKELAYTQYFYLNHIFSNANKQRREEKKKLKQVRKEAPPKDTALVDLKQEQLAPKQHNTIGPAPQQQRTPTAQPAPAQASTRRDTLLSGLSAAPALPADQRVYTLYHQITWQTNSYKFSDTRPDSAFYGDFLVDKRGLRFFLETKKLENTFKLQTFKLKPQPRISATDRALPRESDLLEVGLVHSLYIINQEPVDTGLIHDLFLTGRLNFSPGERLRIRAYGHLGIGANAGDFRLNGELFLNLKKIGNLRLEVVNQLYSPSLVSHRFYVTQTEIWKNNFSKTLETSLMGTYSLPSFHFSLSGQYHLLNKLVYFGTDGLPRQSGTFSIFQLSAQKDFHLGALHLENWVGLQQATSNVLPLPQFYSRHSIYLQKKIFKKVMLSKIGLDARLASSYTPPSYLPLTGQFYLQQEQALPFTPLLDAHLSFKVKTFRFFFKIENILPMVTRRYYFQTAGYPLPFGLSNGGMRMGISWRLVD